MEYKVGDIVHYEAFGGVPRAVVVIARHGNVKHGRPGFDGYEVDDLGNTREGHPVWGYDFQIIATHTREELDSANPARREFILARFVPFG